MVGGKGGLGGDERRFVFLVILYNFEKRLLGGRGGGWSFAFPVEQLLVKYPQNSVTRIEITRK